MDKTAQKKNSARGSVDGLLFTFHGGGWLEGLELELFNWVGLVGSTYRVLGLSVN